MRNTCYYAKFRRRATKPAGFQVSSKYTHADISDVRAKLARIGLMTRPRFFWYYRASMEGARLMSALCREAFKTIVDSLR